MRKLLFVMFSVVAMFVLVACGNKVDEDVSEKYIAKAEEIVALLNDANYQEVHAMLDEDMKVGLPEEEMKELFTEAFGQAGDFEKFNKSSIEEDDGYYVVVLAANYSKENQVFTIFFNDQGEVAGLWIK